MTGLSISISKFSALGRPEVAELMTVPVADWLRFIAAAPADEFVGSMAHSGWSPAVFDPPRRLKDNVKRVGALVLDHDKAGDWDRLHALWAASYGVIYTTKSHGAPGTDGARLRVVLPFARPVTVEEHAKIWDWAARRSAEAGCPIDTQCRDASRFWYDPTLPPGGWRSEPLDGTALLEPDVILAAVTSPRLTVLKQACADLAPSIRIDRARKYLAKIPAAVDGSGGHTQTFNAVAHVMIGFDLDLDVAAQIIAEDYNPRCVPPWSDKDLAHKIASVAKGCNRPRGYLLNERPRIDSTRTAASYAPEAPATLDVDWTEMLLTKKDRTVRRDYHNTLVFVRHYPDYRGKWSLDQMTGSPWFDGAPVRDSFVHDLRADAGRRLGYTPPPGDVEAAIVKSSEDRPFHPILQYLRSLDWDGGPRLSAMARDYLGSDVAHHAQMVRKFMIGAAARALWPGCKHDTALMLVGAQGLFKSTFFNLLGGAWHSDTFIDITNKDGFMQLHSAWIYELAELENVVMGRAESRLKAWMTSSHDSYRAPYGKTIARRPRGVVICGTTNRSQFLTDDTGSRRFWIVPIRRAIPVGLLAEMRDQLWAEAVCAAESGEPWWLDAETDAAREAANVDYAEDDVWTEKIMRHMAGPRYTETTVGDVLTDVLAIEVGRQTRWDQMRAARALTAAGWRRVRIYEGSGRRWAYVRTNQTTLDEVGVVNCE